jgi:hypothetical protein
MSTGAVAYLEYRVSTVPRGPYACAFTLHCTQLEALQLYALTGLGGADPSYEVADLSVSAHQAYESLKDDIVTTKMLRLEATSELQVEMDSWKGRQPLSERIRAAIAALQCLGEDARLVFFLTI